MFIVKLDGKDLIEEICLWPSSPVVFEVFPFRIVGKE